MTLFYQIFQTIVFVKLLYVQCGMVGCSSKLLWYNLLQAQPDRHWQYKICGVNASCAAFSGLNTLSMFMIDNYI